MGASASYSCFVVMLRFIVLLLLVVAVQSRTRSGGSSRVRQCSCQEQSLCFKDLERMGEQCVDQCWSHTSRITSRPQALRQCFRGQEKHATEFEACAQRNMKSCVQSHHGPMIPKQSIAGIMRAAEKKIRKMSQSAVSSGMGGNMNRLISTGEALGGCIKDCFNAKTAGGVCLKKYKCQPLLPNEDKAGKLISKCLRIDFKREGGALCNCALNAGVRDLANVCSILSLMGPRGR